MKPILTILLGYLLLLPTVAVASPMTFDVFGHLGDTSGTITGTFTIDTESASVGTLRDGGLLYPVLASSFTIAPEHTSPKYGPLPTVTGSVANYCSGYCIIGLPGEDLPVLHLDIKPYVARLAFTPRFGAFFVQESDLGYKHGRHANISYNIHDGVVHEASVPEPSSWLLVVVGLCAVVGVAQRKKAALTAL